MGEEPFYTVQEAAKLLNVTDGAVRLAVLEKRLECVRKYGRKLIPAAALKAYEQRTRLDGVKPTGRPKKQKGETDAG